LNRRDFVKGLSGLVLSSSLYSFESTSNCPKEHSIEQLFNWEKRTIDENEWCNINAYSIGFRIGDAILVEVEPKKDMDFIRLNSKMQRSSNWNTPLEDYSFNSNFIYCNNKAYTLTGTDRFCPMQNLNLKLKITNNDFSLFSKKQEKIIQEYYIEINDRDWIIQKFGKLDPRFTRKEKQQSTLTLEQIEAAKLYALERQKLETEELPKQWRHDRVSHAILEGYANPRPYLMCSDLTYGARRFNYFYDAKGKKIEGTEKEIRPHVGVDCNSSSDYQKPITAAMSGKVVFSEKDLPLLGSTVMIDHGLGLYTIYAHLYNSKYRAFFGKEVSKGEIIGSVGKTGRVYGPHLHFHGKLHGLNINPISLEILNKVFKQ